MEKAAEVAREMGFSEDRIEDLKTAVSEACTNAIEHGHRITTGLATTYACQREPSSE